MIPARFADIIEQSFTLMEAVFSSADPASIASSEIMVLLMATAGQETHWQQRFQADGGPARSYWQFETEGLANVTRTTRAGVILAALDIDVRQAFEAIAYNDVLACCMARLNYWAVPAPLPMIGDVTGAYQYYVSTWRPGSPDETRWPPVYRTSLAAFGHS